MRVMNIKKKYLMIFLLSILLLSGMKDTVFAAPLENKSPDMILKEITETELSKDIASVEMIGVKKDNIYVYNTNKVQDEVDGKFNTIVGIITFLLIGLACCTSKSKEQKLFN